VPAERRMVTESEPNAYGLIHKRKNGKDRWSCYDKRNGMFTKDGDLSVIQPLNLFILVIQIRLKRQSKEQKKGWLKIQMKSANCIIYTNTEKILQTIRIFYNMELTRFKYLVTDEKPEIILCNPIACNLVKSLMYGYENYGISNVKLWVKHDIPEDEIWLMYTDRLEKVKIKDGRETNG
jgi:hypothetical protein